MLFIVNEFTRSPVREFPICFKKCVKLFGLTREVLKFREGHMNLFLRLENRINITSKKIQASKSSKQTMAIKLNILIEENSTLTM